MKIYVVYFNYSENPNVVDGVFSSIQKAYEYIDKRLDEYDKFRHEQHTAEALLAVCYRSYLHAYHYGFYDIEIRELDDTSGRYEYNNAIH